MILTKKILQISALVFLALSCFSCKEGCVEADEFDVESVVIESKPVKDGIFGSYDSASGGQRANWHGTDLRSNGDMFLIQIDGAWSSLEGESMGEDALRALPSCYDGRASSTHKYFNLCAKLQSGMSPNCICYKNQEPTPELDIAGRLLAVDCSIADNQEDPSKCSCTKQHGSASDYGVYHFPLTILNKNETYKTADEQSNCKYDKGMGAYIALWGPRGAAVPLRAYHLFSEEEICNIPRDSNGNCIDSNGRDQARYVFRSANNRIFMKDDANGNNGIDTDSADDIYHAPNEEIKTIMWDSYYSDNYGKYNIRILRGVGNVNDPGLLEFLVTLVEEVLLGKINSEGVRDGGIIEFMYKSIIQDSGFVLVVQTSLVLYITLFGAAHVFGLVEISTRKELLNRVLKIGLIMFFISKDSWYFYNKIVVAFFKDSMDYLVAMIMNLMDAKFDQSTMIKIAQMDRAVAISNATRFSYVDLVIKNLMSAATSKKVFGLFYNSIFGFLYIPIIYALIFGFIYVMLYICSLYIVNMIKIIFVLCLGPIFMIFTLFTRTAAMFKNWLAFLGARSLEIIILFTVLYMFLMIIDKAFTDLLFYRVCGENKGNNVFKLIVLIAYIDRSFMEWVFKFINVGGLLFITYLIAQKTPGLSGSLIKIGGVSAGGGGAAMAGGMLSAGLSLAKGAAGGIATVSATAARYGIRGATLAGRKAGIDIGSSIPFRSPRSLYRDSIIDGAIKKAQAAAGGKTGKERDQFIRDSARKELQALIYKEPNKMAFAGVDMHNISARFDKKLVKEPLKKFLKEETKRRKSDAPGKINFGQEARNDVMKAAENWAKNNLYDGAGEVVGKYLKDSAGLNSLIDKRTELSSSRAAQIFAGDADSQKRYMNYLLDKEAANAKKKADAVQSGVFSEAANAIGRAYDALRRDRFSNPKQMQSNFVRKVGDIENNTPWYKKNRFRSAPKQVRIQTQKDLLTSRLVGNLNDDQRKAFQDRLRHLAGKNLSDASQSGLLTAQLKNSDGISLFEKTAKLAQMSALTNPELDVTKEHADIMKRHLMDREVAISGFITKGEIQNALDERAKIAQMNEMAKGMKFYEENKARLAALDQSLVNYSNAQVAQVTTQIAAIDHTNPQATQAVGLIADKLNIDFGASINKALLEQPDVGLKASNVGLGVAPTKAGDKDPSVVNALRISKNHIDAQLKLHQMNLKIKEYELTRVADPTEQSRLKIEIDDLKREVKKYESESNRLEVDIRVGEESL